MKTVITFGTYDLFHIGHLNVLRRAAGLGDRLVVGVSSDKLNRLKKSKSSTFSAHERMEIIGAMRCVNHVFAEDSLEQKREYIEQYAADVLVMGDDWKGKFDHLADICQVVYLPRTPGISTTAIVETFTSQPVPASHE